MQNSHAKPQKNPVAGDGIVGFEVISDIITRMKDGRKKYGRFLEANNGRSALRDLYQELLDASHYTKQLLMESESTLSLTDADEFCLLLYGTCNKKELNTLDMLSKLSIAWGIGEKIAKRLES